MCCKIITLVKLFQDFGIVFPSLSQEKKIFEIVKNGKLFFFTDRDWVVLDKMAELLLKRV